LWRGVTCLLLVTAGGCGFPPRPLDQPRQFPTPYPAIKTWAVAPLRNETGTTQADGTAMADRLTQQLQQVAGIRVLPVNRVLEAMAAIEINAIDSTAKVYRLMEVLGVDGLLVGTLSAWDPYEPPKIGLTMQLYSREVADAQTPDPRKLTRAATDDWLPGVRATRQPIATVSHHFDAANGDTLKYLRHYAHGRVPPDSPAGWRRYLLSMDLYAEFVSHEVMRRLFAAEWKRLTVEVNQAESAQPETGAPVSPQ
jgi:hypothetical protein